MTYKHHRGNAILWASLRVVTLVTNWACPLRGPEAMLEELLQEIFVPVGHQPSKPG